MEESGSEGRREAQVRKERYRRRKEGETGDRNEV